MQITYLYELFTWSGPLPRDSNPDMLIQSQMARRIRCGRVVRRVPLLADRLSAVHSVIERNQNQIGLGERMAQNALIVLTDSK